MRGRITRVFDRYVGGRSVLLVQESGQAKSPPKVIASTLSRLSCCSIGKHSTPQRTWYLPADVDTIAVGIGTAFDARRAASFASPSVSRSRYKCRTSAMLSLVRFRLPGASGLAAK